jgi:uncharacterized protein YjiS (DUF1127 family)
MNGSLCTTTSSVPAVSSHFQERSVRPGLQRAIDTVLLWHDRVKSRRTLAMLDDRMLRDVGIDQATARQESTLPFWR